MRAPAMPLQQQRLPPLWLASAALTAAIVTAFGVARWIDHFASDPNAEDFRLHAVAARVGLTHGWSHIYELGLQQAASQGLGPIDSMHIFVSPPPAAWMTVPLAWLPIPAGFLVWTLISLAAFIATGWLICPGPRFVRVTLVLASLALWPVHYQFWLGQWTAATIALLGVCWLMLESRHWTVAGVAMALAFCLKPQDCLLLPPALLVSGRWRPLVGFAATGGALAALSAFSLSTAGVSSWLSDLALVHSNPFNAPLTYSFLFGSGSLASAVEVALGAAALAIAWFRRDRLDLVFALGLVGTTASATYLHEDDVAVLVLGGWILLRAGPSLGQKAWLPVGVAAAQLISIGLPIPMLLWEPAWIALLGLEPALKKIEPRAVREPGWSIP